MKKYALHASMSNVIRTRVSMEMMAASFAKTL
jgi:hypothetical protein